MPHWRGPFAQLGFSSAYLTGASRAAEASPSIFIYERGDTIETRLGSRLASDRLPFSADAERGLDQHVRPFFFFFFSRTSDKKLLAS